MPQVTFKRTPRIVLHDFVKAIVFPQKGVVAVLALQLY